MVVRVTNRCIGSTFVFAKIQFLSGGTTFDEVASDKRIGEISVNYNDTKSHILKKALFDAFPETVYKSSTEPTKDGSDNDLLK